MSPRAINISAYTAVLMVAACHGCGHEDTADTYSGGLGGDTGDTQVMDTFPDTDHPHTGDTGEPPLDGTIKGTVTVQLYEEIDGIEVPVSWDDFSPGWVFGGIFVSAFRYDAISRETTYYATTSILDPTPDPNEYELDVYATTIDSVRVYAALDYWNDSIISSYDPTGLYPTAVSVTGGDTVNGIDITIMVRVTDGDLCYDCYGGPGYCEGDCGGCDTVDVSGPITVDTWGFANQPAIAMFATTGNEGPYYYYISDKVYLKPAEEEPTTNYSGDYLIDVCSDAGEWNLLGAWDSNNNGLFDPDDYWGEYVEGEDPANPIFVSSTDLPDTEIHIPIEGAGLQVVPFVQVTGTISTAEDTFDTLFSSFDDYTGDSLIYVAALKYRPEGDLDVSTIVDDSYAFLIYTPEEWAGQQELDYAFYAPANSIIYLWAYADVEPNGLVNEHLEPGGPAGGHDYGRITTTTEDLDENIVMVSEMEETGVPE